VSDGVGGGGTGGPTSGAPAAGLKPTDVVDAKALNANVISAFKIISLPQNVVNLNQPLTVRWTQLRRARRDATRDNGAIMTVAIQFRGGTGTISVEQILTTEAGGLLPKGLNVTGIYVNASDKELWNDIEVDVPATCSATTPAHLVLTSGQQAVNVVFEFWVDCP
jgi:hypothetical protein